MNPVQQLLHALDAHSTVFKEEDIQWAFENKKTRKAVTEWVEEFLGPETLLSQEEAELYSKLDKNGTAHRISANCDLSVIRPYFDDQIRTALNSLKDSTSAIERHNRVLEQQQQALLSLQESNGQVRERWKRIAGQRQKRRKQEKQNIELAVEELIESTAFGIDVAQRQLQSASSVFPSTVAESLQKDDRILAEINRLAGELEVSGVDDEQQITRSSMLCEILSTNLADEIRCRLDRIHLETKQSPTKFSGTCLENDIDLESSLKAELDSLYSEITAVARMSTSLEFGNPLNEATRKKKAQSDRYVGSVLDSGYNSIAYLLERLDHMKMRARTHASHRAALDTIAGNLHGLRVSMHQSRDSANDRVGNPTSRLTAPDNYEPEFDIASLAAPSNLDHRRLLSDLGIPALDGLRNKDIGDILNLTVSEKDRKTRGISLSVEKSLDSTLTSYLNDSFCTQQMLVDALLADTAYNTVEMFDPELRSEINALEADIGKLGSDMADLDLEKLKTASKERELFINQWAR